MSEPWWSGVPPAQTIVDCGGEPHRLRWVAGELHTLDHADPDGERALAALGGEPCACIELLDAWAHHAHDLRVLVLGGRGGADQVTARSDQGNRAVTMMAVGRRRTATGASSSSLTIRPGRPPGPRGGLGLRGAPGPRAGLGPPGAPGANTDDERLTALLELGGGLERRLAATVVAHHLGEQGRAAPGDRARLSAALYGRVLAALTTWLGTTELALELTLLDPAGTPGLSRRDETIEARLELRWLLDVWARGLEVVWGRFCLSAATADPSTAQLRAVGPDFGEPETITVSATVAR